MKRGSQGSVQFAYDGRGQLIGESNLNPSALFEPAPRRGEMGQQCLDVGLRKVAAQPPGSPLTVADKLAAMGLRDARIGARARARCAHGPRHHRHTKNRPCST